jgi:hypothetical protein
METRKPQFIGDAPTIFEASGNGAHADRTMATAAGVAYQEADRARHHPVTVGRYRILRLIGEGGMGSAVARRLPWDAGPKRLDVSSRSVPYGQRPRMDHPALRSVGQARQGRRVEATLTSMMQGIGRFLPEM